MTIVEWYPQQAIPQWAIVFFSANSKVRTKQPWSANWKNISFWPEWHVALVDYKDNDWVLRVFEQNGGRSSGTGTGSDACRLQWYWWKNAVLWFVY
jgi:predicted PhzF superfamily epimerase YddE/YHI9